MENVKKERKQKKSMLDDYKDDIKYYYNLGVSISSIAKIINDKMPITVTKGTYRHFIETRL